MSKKFLSSFVWILFAVNARAQLHTDSIQIATQRAVSYLNSLSENEFPSYNQRLLLVYLHNKYKLPQAPRKNILKISSLLPEDSVVFCCYKPLIDKKNKVNNSNLLKLYAVTNGIGKLMLWGIHSQKLPLDSCMPEFRNVQGVRDMMHAALSLYWAGAAAILSHRQEILHLRAGYSSAFKTAMEYEKPITDTGMEAILGLLLLNERDSVAYSWIKELLFAQHADGGWSWTGEQNAKPHPHTTLLAIWILQLILHQQ